MSQLSHSVMTYLYVCCLFLFLIYLIHHCISTTWNRASTQRCLNNLWKTPLPSLPILAHCLELHVWELILIALRKVLTLSSRFSWSTSVDPCHLGAASLPVEEKAKICLPILLFPAWQGHITQSKHLPSWVMIICMAISLVPKDSEPQALILVVVQLLSRIWLFAPQGLQHARLHVLYYHPEFAQIHNHWVSDAV